MKCWIAGAISALALLATSAHAAGGSTVTYSVDGQDYEGYFVSKKAEAPFVLLIHDWDGLTDYEVKRANMLAEMGYSVFAADLFGKGVRPTEVKDKRQHTGELYKNRAKMRALMTGALDKAAMLGGDRANAVAMGHGHSHGMPWAWAMSMAMAKVMATAMAMGHGHSHRHGHGHGLAGGELEGVAPQRGRA